MEINQIRLEIDKVDNELFNAVRKRFELAKKIGREKHANNLKVKDVKREEQLIAKLIQKNKSINPIFITELYDLIISESRKIQGAA